MNRLSTEKRVRVIAALCEGVSINATVRMTGVSKPTILKLIRDLGAACVNFHDEHVRGLRSENIQTDEVWSFNYCKAKNVAKAKAAPEAAGDVWTWTAIDRDSKLLIAYHIGGRGKSDAEIFMLDLASRLVTRRLQLTSDAHHAYYDAVVNAFGMSDVDYTQVQKVFGPEMSGKGAERKYSPGRINGIKKATMIGLPDTDEASTSHVERHNLTIRMGMRRFTRPTNAHSKKIEYHICSIAMFFMFYNYCRVHSSLEGKQTPAMACGLSDHAWTLDELLRLLG